MSTVDVICWRQLLTSDVNYWRQLLTSNVNNWHQLLTLEDNCWHYCQQLTSTVDIVDIGRQLLTLDVNNCIWEIVANTPPSPMTLDVKYIWEIAQSCGMWTAFWLWNMCIWNCDMCALWYLRMNCGMCAFEIVELHTD